LENAEETAVYLTAPELFPADAVINVTAGRDTILVAPF
jgi:hypothetical protein